jgi:hypothetical protein
MEGGVSIPDTGGVILAALKDRPQSATALSAGLGQPADTLALFAVLERLERRGEVLRSRTGSGPWIWQVPGAR